MYRPYSYKVRQVIRVISKRRRIQFVISFLSILTNAFFEVLSLASVVPFLSILSSPQTFMESSTARRFTKILGISSVQQAVLVVCTTFAIVTVISAVVRVGTMVVNSKFTLAVGADLSRTVFDRTLHQPYYLHAKQNSSTVIANVTQNVSAFVNGVVGPTIQFLTSSLTVIGIVTTLFVINWIVAVTVSLVFGGAYFAIVRINKKHYAINSAIVVASNDEIFRALQEGLGAIRDVIIDGNQDFYTQTFSKADRMSRDAQNDSSIRSATPKFILEAVGMLLICFIAFTLSNGETKLLSAVPVLGLLAMAAQRLMPAMQSAFGSYSAIAVNIYGLDRIYDVLSAEQSPRTPTDTVACGVGQCIRFDNVDFRYGQDGTLVLRKVSFDILRGQRIGIIGATGSGKSTTMDLLLGLLEPTNGAIYIDGEPLLGDKVFAWQKSLSHVPQVIYLADASISENIAFGVDREHIDMELVYRAARLAQISDHIDSLKDGFDTVVGERGIRMSGGQRQRIGIARALYKNSTVLVFDEATSALDDETEAELMNAIDGLSNDLTIIMIAHRLSTVRRCDKIIKLHKGRLVAFDKPEVILGESV